MSTSSGLESAGRHLNIFIIIIIIINDIYIVQVRKSLSN